MVGSIQIGKDVKVKLFDLNKESVSETLSLYPGRVDRLMKEYNKAVRNELLSIGDDLKQKFMLEIGTYVNGKNKIATKKFYNSIYRKVTSDDFNRVVLEVGSHHPYAGAILRGQGALGKPNPSLVYPSGGESGLEQRMKTWISKKHIAFYYWYEGPKVGRKLKRMDKSRTLFLLMRSVGKLSGFEKYHQGVLPSNRMYQKTSLPSISRNNGVITSIRRPSKSEYYSHRGNRVLLENIFYGMIPEIRQRITELKGSFSSRIELP